MAPRTLRAAIVGASTLLGRELAEQLNQASGAMWDIALLDDEDAIGQMTVAGDEPLVIQPLTPGAFERMDVVFFASDAAAFISGQTLWVDGGLFSKPAWPY